MRVIVTGSRDFTEYCAVWEALDELAASVGAITVVQGGCRTGADEAARSLVERRVHVRVDGAPGYGLETFGADWRHHGHAAGPLRNQDMVDAGADLVLAFYAPPPAKNKGTADCVRRARKAGIPVKEYR